MVLKFLITLAYYVSVCFQIQGSNAVCVCFLLAENFRALCTGNLLIIISPYISILCTISCQYYKANNECASVCLHEHL